MVPNAKRPALLLLAGALWLAGADPSRAASPVKREQFATLLANSQNPSIANRLQRGRSAAPTLVSLQRIDQQLQLQSTRITQRLTNLNNLAHPNPSQARAIDRLRQDLTRREAAIGQRIQAVQRLERQAATPSAPSGL